jgi:hypothetical protein
VTTHQVTVFRAAQRVLAERPDVSGEAWTGLRQACERHQARIDASPHGTYGTYNKGCRCEDCRKFNARYHRERRRGL